MVLSLLPVRYHPGYFGCHAVSLCQEFAVKFVLSLFMTPTANIIPLAVTADQAGWAMATLSDHVVNAVGHIRQRNGIGSHNQSAVDASFIG